MLYIKAYINESTFHSGASKNTKNTKFIKDVNNSVVNCMSDIPGTLHEMYDSFWLLKVDGTLSVCGPYYRDIKVQTQGNANNS